MSATRRGAIIFAGLIVVMVACYLISFVILPSLGTAAALPVITVPGEAYNGALPSQDFNFTNTLMATLLTDVIVVLFAVAAWRASKGWTRDVPNRFQALVELIAEFMYNQAKNFAGVKPLVRNWLFPLAASIFLFLLVANWMKLLPAVDSIGYAHCAHVGVSGYPAIQVGPNAYQMYSDQALYAGRGATEADYEACEHWLHNPSDVPALDALNTAADQLFDQEATLREELDADPTLMAAAKDERINALRLEVTESVWREPSFGLTADQLRKGVVPYVTVVTPWVRGAATDLNLTIGLALIAVFAIQVFGVASQGPNYFQKFINLHALGTIQKRPLGAVDFLVGIFEIISEIGKIISLAFRLFGNMFAGGILLAVMSFLVATLLPVIFYGLEVIVTSIQAYVFAVLTLVFSAQAMEGHHSDDEHHEAEPHEGHAAEEVSPESEPITRTAI